MGEQFKRRTPSPWGEGAALKDEILGAAARMLAESGRETDLSLRAVAREVGIAAPSVYLHFKNRADLVEALRRRAYEELAGDLRKVRETATVERPGAVLRAMARRYVRFATANRRTYRLMFSVEWVEAPRDEATEYPTRLVHQVWTQAVSAVPGENDGRLDAGRVALFLWTSLHGMVSMAVATPYVVDQRTLTDMADQLIDLALAGSQR
ncbi:TetR/AcrR family transcriptional regulator [Streptomyces sp. JW3]|uniref:TetR/AcrR family transcriptional regulator n=1 Tax=Streptomyces sp. JW3 TaxID=3456955 RepID=UPI003FA4BF50